MLTAEAGVVNNPLKSCKYISFRQLNLRFSIKGRIAYLITLYHFVNAIIQISEMHSMSGGED